MRKSKFRTSQFGISFAFKTYYNLCLLSGSVPQGQVLPRGSPGSIHSFRHCLWQWIAEIQAFQACSDSQNCSVHLGQTPTLSHSVYLWVLNYQECKTQIRLRLMGPADRTKKPDSWDPPNPTSNPNFLSGTSVHLMFSPVDFDPLSSFPCISLSVIKHSSSSQPRSDFQGGSNSCREILPYSSRGKMPPAPARPDTPSRGMLKYWSALISINL